MELSKNLDLKIISLDDEADIVISSSENFEKLDEEIGKIIENTGIATEKKKGIISLEDIRKEESYLSGVEQNGVFGEDLKEIKVGNSYLYIDESGKGTIYESINNKTSITGFLVPDTTNFKDITNSEINKKLTRSNIQITNGGWVDLLAGQPWETYYGYGVPASKVVAVRLTVEAWTNAYLDMAVPVICFMNDTTSYKFYNKNYDAANNAVHFTFEIECTQNSIRIKFLNRSTTMTLRMKIAELRLFY